MSKYEIDASQFLDFIEAETAYQVLNGLDPDLNDRRSGDFLIEFDRENDWS